MQALQIKVLGQMWPANPSNTITKGIIKVQLRHQPKLA